MIYFVCVSEEKNFIESTTKGRLSSPVSQPPPLNQPPPVNQPPLGSQSPSVNQPPLVNQPPSVSRLPPVTRRRPAVQPYEVQGVREAQEDKKELSEKETTYTVERMTDVEEAINKEIEAHLRESGIGDLISLNAYLHQFTLTQCIPSHLLKIF